MQEKIASSPAEAADIVAPLTTMHFIGIAVLAVLAIALIVHGMKLARRRREGTRELEARGHLDRTGAMPVADPDTPTTIADRATPVPEPVKPVAADPSTRQQDAGAPVAPSVEPTPAAHAPAVTTPEPEPAPQAPVPSVATPELVPALELPVVSAPSPAAEPAEPVTATAPPLPPTATAPAGDLTLLKGLGPKVAAQMTALGIPSVAALAALSDEQADALAGQLGAFAPRMARDRWLEQARLLAAGDRAGFEARFGKL